MTTTLPNLAYEPWRRRCSAAAWELRQLGYALFPIKPWGNTPLVKGWQHAALSGKVRTTERDVTDGEWIVIATHKVMDFWDDIPGPNIGILAGHHGLFVIDVDPRHGGNDSLAKLPLLPETATVTTPSGGRHYYFRSPVVYGNGVSKIAQGIDHRGRGGYVVAPPSRREFKDRWIEYTWLSGPMPISELAEVPDWLHDRLAETSTRSKPRYRGITSTTCDPWTQADSVNAEDWLINACAMLIDTPEGERNDRFTSLLAKGLFWAADGLLDPDTVIEVLAEAAAISGLGASEITATTTSITNYVARSIEP
jgi:bifunctional DNA primase/polymerase-like protein